MPSSMEAGKIPSCFNDRAEENDMLYAMQLATASVLPMALRSTVELGMLDVLYKKGLGSMISTSQVAFELRTDNPDASSIIDQMLCLLTSHSILTCSVKADCGGGGCRRLFGLAPVASFFTKKRDEGLVDLLLLLVQDKSFLDVWFHLKDVILEGGNPFERANGMTALSYIGNNPGFTGQFRDSMTEYNKLFMKEILRTYKGFEGVNTITRSAEYLHVHNQLVRFITL